MVNSGFWCVFLFTASTGMVLESPITDKVVLIPGAVSLNLCKALLELMTPKLAKSQLV